MVFLERIPWICIFLVCALTMMMVYKLLVQTLDYLNWQKEPWSHLSCWWTLESYITYEWVKSWKENTEEMAYVVWRVLMKKYTKARLGIQRNPQLLVSTPYLSAFAAIFLSIVDQLSNLLHFNEISSYNRIIN